MPNILGEADPRNGSKNEKVQERSQLPLPAPTQTQSKGKKTTRSISHDSTGLFISDEPEGMTDSIYDEPEAQLRSGKGFELHIDNRFSSQWPILCEANTTGKKSICDKNKARDQI